MSWNQLTTGNYNAGTGQIASVSFTGAQTPGSLLIMQVFYLIPSGTPSGDLSISDPTNGSWTKGHAAWLATTGTWAIYGGTFYVPSNTASTTLTVSISGYFSGGELSQCYIEEFTGHLASGPWNTGSENLSDEAGGSQTFSGPLLTTTVDGALILVTGADQGDNDASSFTQGASFTLLQTEVSVACPFADEWMVQTTHGGITPTIVSNPASADTKGFYMLAAAFKPASGGTTVSISKGSLALSPKALHVNEAYVLSKASLSLGAKALHVNEAYVISKGSLALGGKSLHINEVIAISKAALTLAGKSLTATSGTVIAIAKAALTATGQALHVNEAIVISKAALATAAKSLHVNEALVISKGTLTAAGKSLHVNEAIAIGKGTLALAGKSLTALGATVVSIAAGTMTFTGKSLSAGVGGLHAVTRKYINVWNMWTNRPKSGGI